MNKIVAKDPPQDGRNWDCQCARCGSSIHWEVCGRCGGEGITDPGELYEEDPLWYDPDDFEPCPSCNGDSSWGICLSSPEWCEAHPIPGREQIKRGQIEWFTLDPDPVPTARVASAPPTPSSASCPGSPDPAP